MGKMIRSSIQMSESIKNQQVKDLLIQSTGG
jgi:hypothetical protein